MQTMDPYRKALFTNEQNGKYAYNKVEHRINTRTRAKKENRSKAGRQLQAAKIRHMRRLYKIMAHHKQIAYVKQQFKTGSERLHKVAYNR